MKQKVQFTLLMLFSVVLLSQTVMGQPGTLESGAPLAPHGATSPQWQEAKLAQLQATDGDVVAPPFGVSADYWSFLIPEDNEQTAARVVLGRKLYFDPKLSLDDSVACSSCHDVNRGFADGEPTSEGIDGQFGKRNSPTTLNTVFLHNMFWDGRSPSLDHQAMQPIINPIEMGMPNDEAVIIAKIKDDAEYKKLFQAAYGRDVNYPDIGRALAAFERTLNFLDSSFRRYISGQEDAISENAKQGWILFNTQGRCMSCHPISPSSPVGSDSKFHNIGVSAEQSNFNEWIHAATTALDADDSDEAIDQLALDSDAGQLGRFIVTRNPADIGAFRTPLLTNVGITAPYMHDGTFETLWDVVDHYNSGGDPNIYLDGGIEPLRLTELQVAQLVEFLFSLTDVRFASQNQQELVRQANIAMNKKMRPHRNIKVATRAVLSFESASDEKKGDSTVRRATFENDRQVELNFVYPRKDQ